ncbi:MAG: xanthine dehydrogenase small subunit [Bacteroidetes bacterium HGW-Bacteroidetes-21]|jgi:xanthine dehydrogenase small subunit|nr:MAG: xanthine dehydrogenase small subunit [Bacteroidetes bacterium HGW-Bacteroidetes-21]
MKKTKSTITFIFNGEAVSVNFGNENLLPSTTVLNWLRNTQNHKEVKEGCAEGDCGACTVVVAEPAPDGQSLIYKAVNACILFLPTLDGKMLITTAGLSPLTNDTKELHPVQKAIVHEHATQCGFCTPGFAMSLFALYHKPGKHSHLEINNALAGNLCRCTGYDSIRKAAKSALIGNRTDAFSKKESEIARLLQNVNDCKTTLEIKHPLQKYIRPVELKELLELRALYPEALIVNGSTDAALRQSKHFENLPFIIDISAISELQTFEISDNTIIAGAGLCLEDLRLQCEQVYPALYDILSVFASRQIRNTATLGGNLGSASPIGDTLPLLMAGNAEIEASSLRCKRKIPAREFVKSYRTTALSKNEIISKVHIPLPQKDEIIKMYKVSKRHDMDISTVSAAFLLNKSKTGLVKDFSVYFGGMAATTLPAAKTIRFLMGKKWEESIVIKAMKILEKEFKPLSDARSGADFRNLAAAGLLMKFYHETKDV